MPAILPQAERKQTITVSMAQPMIKALDTLAKRRTISRSALIEGMIRDALAQREAGKAAS